MANFRLLGDSSWDSIFGVNNQVSDTTILTGLWISSIVGAAVTILFAVLQRTSLLYRYRLIADNVRVKPPKLQEHGLISLVDWAIKSISVSDGHFVLSVGLDALIMVKLCALGVQLFLPLCILSVVVLIPLHWNGGALKHVDAYQSGFMRLTMSNIQPGSPVFWVHVIFVYIYLAWAMFILRLHCAQYLIIRQNYLTKGDNVNLWRTLYEPKEQQEHLHAGEKKISTLLRSVPIIKAIMPSFLSTSAASAMTAKDSDNEEGVNPLYGEASARGLSPVGDMAAAGIRSSLCFLDEPQGRAAPPHGQAPGSALDLVHQSLSPTMPTKGRSCSSCMVVGYAAANEQRGRSLRRFAYSHGPRMLTASINQKLQHAAPGQQLQLHRRGNKRRQVPQTRLGQTSITSVEKEPRGQEGLFPFEQRVMAEEPPTERSSLAEIGSGGFYRRAPSSGNTLGCGNVEVPVAEATERTQQHNEAEPTATAAAAGAGAFDLAAAGAGTAAAATACAAAAEMATRTVVVAAPSPVGAAMTVATRSDGIHAHAEQPTGTLHPVLPPRQSADVPRMLHECGINSCRGALGRDVLDLEIGLGSASLEGNVTGVGSGLRTSAPNQSPMQMDSDAHQLVWWQKWVEGVGKEPVEKLQEILRSRSSRTPNSGGKAPGSALLDTGLKRPSVGHRKTVNAVDMYGRPVAVLAQHYAVLVTDVVERRPREHVPAVQVEQSPSQGDTAEAPDATVTRKRRQALCLPTWLSSWCDLRYGNQAARKLNPKLRATSSEETMERGPGGAYRAANFSLLPFGSLRHILPNRVVAPVQNPLTHSGSNALHPPSTPLNLGTPCADPDLCDEATIKTKSLSLSSLHASASLVLGPFASTGRKVGGEKLLTLFEMMARDAQEKLAAVGSVTEALGPVQTQRSNTISHTDLVRDPAHLHLLQVADLPTVASATHPAQGLPPEAMGDGLAASRRSTAHVPSPLDGAASALGGAEAASLATTAIQRRQERPHGNVAGAGPVAEASGVTEEKERQVGQGPEHEGVSNRSDSPGGAAAGGVAHGEAASKAGVEIREEQSAVSDSAMLAAPPPEWQQQQEPTNAAYPHLPDTEITGEAERDSGMARAAALARWEVVRQAVRNGRIAQLPRSYHYSVVSATFLRLFPEEYYRAIQVVNFKEVDLLLMQADNHLAQYEYAINYEEKTGKELVGRIGFCGLVGERRRLWQYHLEKINDLMDKVRKARVEAANKARTSSWFVFFRTQRAAAIASQCVIHSEDNRQFRVHPAPGPDEVNWSALWSNFRERDLRRNLIRPLVALMVVFPIGIFTGGVTQLDYLLCPSHVCAGLEIDSQVWKSANCTSEIMRRETQQVSWQWYCMQQDPVAKLLKRLVVAWLPSLLLILWQGMVLPLFFTFVVQISRQARSLSEADRLVAKNMFYFGIFNVFLGGVVGSTITQGINSAIEKGPSEILNLIGTYVPTSSNFFINYTMFRVLVSVPLRMLWPHIGIRMYLIRRYLRFSCIITEREQASLMAPVSPRYGFEVGMVMIIFLIGFAFSVVSPVLLPMALVFFMISWLFWRWALLYVYVRKYEGGGTMWPFIFSRVMVCMAIFPLFTACVFITKHAYVQAIVLLVTVPVILVRFNKYIHYRFNTGIKAMPMVATIDAPYARVEPWVYTPPPLLTNLAGWHPDWSKCWSGWNMPVMYG